MAWIKGESMRTRPPGNWRQITPLFEIAGLYYRSRNAKRFLAGLEIKQNYNEYFLPLEARREPTVKHEGDAIAIDAQWERRSLIWPLRWDRIPRKGPVGYVPSEYAVEIAADPDLRSAPLAIDFYDYSTDEQGEIAIRCSVLAPDKAR